MLEWFGKRLRELHEKRRDERGFTLIELLVVVIIIGILAAIAIPVFLNQREQAQDAAAQSDLRNLAAAATAFAADNQGSYAGMDTDALTADYGYTQSEGVTMGEITPVGGGDSFTVVATSASSNTWNYDSARGTVEEGDGTT